MKRFLAALLFLVFLQFPAPGLTQTTSRVLCTTYPIYLIAQNVAKGREGLKLDLMLPSNLGCPHDYALTPQDMKKVESADILIVNGLGMEEFLGSSLKKVGRKLKVIDSSQGIPGILQYTENHEEEEDPDHATSSGAPHDYAEEGHHHHEGPNPHLFASPRQAALIAKVIAEGLAQADPKGAKLYRANADIFAKRMKALDGDFVDIGRRLKNNRIVTQHGVFDYLARDMGLEISAVIQAHAGQEPSAAEMLDLVKDIQKAKVGGIFTEPQYRSKTASTLAKEIGIPLGVLNPVASGPEKAGLDYYEKTMRQNLATLQKVLKTR